VAQTERDTNGICFMLEVTEHFIHQLSEVDWFTRVSDSCHAETPKTQPPSFMSVTLAAFNLRIINNSVVTYAFKYGL
jgi:hypothetical protein